jgi:hypothetical protein
MLPRLSGRRTAGAAALLAVLLAPAAAAAANKKTITGDETLGNDVVFDTFTVEKGGILRVSSLASDPNGGWLRIRANTITIKMGAVVIADGAGYVGKNGADGDAPPTTSGGGGLGATPGIPGGGGGFFGVGANGTSEATSGTCLDYGPSSPGGKAFFDLKAMTPIPGAGGGAANLAQTAGTAGGNGGGGIELDAAVIVIDGMISAGGAKPFATGGVGPGGGAGGTIIIKSALLSGGGMLQVLGGAGAHGNGSTNVAMPITANNGGGGSGGVIVFRLPAGVTPPSSLMLGLAAGADGDCPATTAPAGMMISDPLAIGCLDLDGDMHYSAQCPGSQGDDCDDTDPGIHPGVPEVCDGKDNDCNGKIDDGDDLCAPGLACMAGHCTALPDAGPGDAGTTDGGAPPDHLEFGGGCALPGSPRSDGWPEGAAAVLAFGLGALSLAASRRRPSPRARPRR